MLYYFNKKKNRFEELKRVSKCDYKILINDVILRENLTGYYGLQKTPEGGEYVSTIDGIDFYWIDYAKTCIGGNAYRVFHPDYIGFMWKSVYIEY